MASDGFTLIQSAPQLIIIPGLMILLTVLSLNVFGDGLRDALDPKSKDQPAKGAASSRGKADVGVAVAAEQS